MTPDRLRELPAAIARVNCSGARHAVRWEGGDLIALDHDDPEGERALAALGGTSCTCLEVLGAWAAPEGEPRPPLCAQPRTAGSGTDRGSADWPVPLPGHDRPSQRRAGRWHRQMDGDGTVGQQRLRHGHRRPHKWSRQPIVHSRGGHRAPCRPRTRAHPPHGGHRHCPAPRRRVGSGRPAGPTGARGVALRTGVMCAAGMAGRPGSGRRARGGRVGRRRQPRGRRERPHPGETAPCLGYDRLGSRPDGGGRALLHKPARIGWTARHDDERRLEPRPTKAAPHRDPRGD